MKLGFEKRVTAIKSYLSDHLGQEVSFSNLRLGLRSALGDEAANLTKSQILHALKTLRSRMDDTSVLQIIAEDAVLLRMHATVLGRREGTGKQTKLSISHAAWHFLFGKHSESNGVRYFLPSKIESRAEGDPIDSRIAHLSRKMGASILLDSGSTTRAFVRVMLDSPRVPLMIYPSSNDPMPRMFMPSIVTNNPRVAVDILDSKHVDQFDVRVIGGTVRGQYGSIAGDFAESCFNAWGFVSGVIGYDVAILGATGIRHDWGGIESFGVEHRVEASIKIRFLAAANVRCIIMDSSKLADHEVACVFCPLNSKQLDVVFTDNDREDEAAKLYIKAIAGGVIPVIADVRKQENGEGGNLDAFKLALRALGCAEKNLPMECATHEGSRPVVKSDAPPKKSRAARIDDGGRKRSE